MSDAITKDQWQARAALCELLALSFRYPDAVLAEVVCNGEWADAANEIAAVVGVDWSAGDLVGDAAVPGCDDAGDAGDAGDADDSGDAGDADKLLHALRAEATRLFVGSPEPVISPYEGVWRANDDGVDALLFVNPHSMEVERFCKACGLGRPEGTNEPLDYVATELELLEYLAARAAVDAAGGATGADDASECAGSDDEMTASDACENNAEGIDAMVASQDLPGGSAEVAFDQFMTTHVQLWMPRFAANVQQESRLAFFREAARLLERSLESMI